MNIGSYMPDVLARSMVTDKCWIWLGGRSTKGYGQISRGGKHLQVHRIAYESMHGPIPDGSVIDHVCHDPATCAGGTCVHRICVNPGHLAAVTNQENLRRQTPAAKTHCVRGHELTGSNVMRTPSGHRSCGTCHKWHSSRVRRYSVAPSVIRRWARLNGFSVAERGALSKAVIAAWDAAHPGREFTATDVTPLADTA